MASRRKYLHVGLVSASLPQTLALHHSLPLTTLGYLSLAKMGFPPMLTLESD
ncbi:hypothetical protein JCM19231_4833 [Vibrio ishigakensis]|uniref:Uncharacterized protein n=1 Tax=Vibrio ishigakensis TaxID=1481914 RepID=A0A0B8NYS5_9VIBR|nr:hypothetical protein JCM19231_4833 [Vibrio ishigakensis]